MRYGYSLPRGMAKYFSLWEVELTQRWRYRVPLGGHSTAIYLSTNLFRRLNSSNMLLGEVSVKSDSHLHGTVNISHHDSVTVGHGLNFWEVYQCPFWLSYDVTLIDYYLVSYYLTSTVHHLGKWLSSRLMKIMMENYTFAPTENEFGKEAPSS